MGAFHCPLGATSYDTSGCIRCGLCIARNKLEAIAATQTLREYFKTHVSKRQQGYLIQKISVCGKGGVGKSTVTALMAKALENLGYSLLVLDTDESNMGLHKKLGMSNAPKPLVTNTTGLAWGDDPENDLHWMKADKIRIVDIPERYIVQNKNIRLLMMGKIEDPLQGCACTMADLARDLVVKLELSPKEIVIIDSEAGVESFGRGVERGADTVLIVTEPSYESIELASRIQYMAEGIGIQRIRAIMNKVPDEYIGAKLEDTLIEKDIRFLGTVQTDQELLLAAFSGKPADDTGVQKVMNKLARLMLDEAEMKYEKEERKSK